MFITVYYVYLYTIKKRIILLPTLHNCIIAKYAEIITYGKCTSSVLHVTINANIMTGILKVQLLHTLM